MVLWLLKSSPEFSGFPGFLLNLGFPSSNFRLSSFPVNPAASDVQLQRTAGSLNPLVA
jgi:hypothetical protein